MMDGPSSIQTRRTAIREREVIYISDEDEKISEIHNDAVDKCGGSESEIAREALFRKAEFENRSKSQKGVSRKGSAFDECGDRESEKAIGDQVRLMENLEMEKVEKSLLRIDGLRKKIREIHDLVRRETPDFIQCESRKRDEGDGDQVRVRDVENLEMERVEEASEALSRKAEFGKRHTINIGVCRNVLGFECGDTSEGDDGNEVGIQGIEMLEKEKLEAVEEASVIGNSVIVYVMEDGTAIVEMREETWEEIEWLKRNCVEDGKIVVEEVIVESEEDEKDIDVPKKVMNANEEVGKKRKRVFVVDPLVSSKEDGDGLCMTQQFEKKTKKSSETLGNPMCFDSDEEHSSSSSDEDDDDYVDDFDDDDGNNTSIWNHDSDDGVEKEERRTRKPTKKRCARMSKAEMLELLLNTVWEKGRDTVDSEDESKRKDDEERLPLKFNFGREEPKPVEKSAEDELMNKLWADFDLILTSSEIGSASPSKVDIENISKPEAETDPATLCLQGKHVYILDEEIGIICRRCRFIKQEIKNVIPTLSTDWSKMSRKKVGADEGDSSAWQGMDFVNAGANDRDSCLPRKGTVWDIIPGIRKNLLHHQKEACEFIWTNLAGGIDLDVLKKSCNSDVTGGCVISHTPGTGKTLTTLASVKPFFKLFENFRMLLIAPKSPLPNWGLEIKKWNINIPFHNLSSPEFSGEEDRLARELILGKSQNGKWKRLVKLVSWSKGGSIIGCTYKLFEKLAGIKLVKGKDGKKPRQKILDKHDEEIRKILLEMPDLVILDEGHTPRNANSSISKTLQNVKTKSRVILSGTPFQNNFKELYNIFQWVRPKFADKISPKTPRVYQRKSKLGESNEAREVFFDLVNSIGVEANQESLKKIRAMLDKFVHIYKGGILQKLPGLRDWLVVLNPSLLQKEHLERVKTIKNHLELEHTVSLISVHPSLLKKGGCSQDVPSKSVKRLDIVDGVKTRFVMELIQLTSAMDERVLVFSQFLDPLEFIKDQLHSRFNWIEGEEILMMVGSNNMKNRQHSIDLFNKSDNNVKVLLASIKACGEGITLTGASRIVLLDVVWNPSVEKQAISRAYRPGQKKVVYIYHLVIVGTMEEEKYRQQGDKNKMSTLVFSSINRHGDNQNGGSTTSHDKILEIMVEHDQLRDIFKEVRCIPAKE